MKKRTLLKIFMGVLIPLFLITACDEVLQFPNMPIVKSVDSVQINFLINVITNSSTMRSSAPLVLECSINKNNWEVYARTGYKVLVSIDTIGGKHIYQKKLLDLVQKDGEPVHTAALKLKRGSTYVITEFAVLVRGLLHVSGDRGWPLSITPNVGSNLAAYVQTPLPTTIIPGNPVGVPSGSNSVVMKDSDNSLWVSEQTILMETVPPKVDNGTPTYWWAVDYGYKDDAIHSYYLGPIDQPSCNVRPLQGETYMQ